MPDNRTTSAYIADIDGLRAVSVLGVIVFHLNAQWLSGGFVGVDVFFVISGYLITNILHKESLNGVFSMSRFYLRRARRILPALMAMLVLNLLLAGWLFAPDLLIDNASATLSALLFSSNIWFYLQSGYFDQEAILKPLLHTWSLGVEEQFYLFWPILIWLFYRRLNSVVLLLLSLGFTLLSELVTRANPELGFYVLIFRIQEFLLGASLVYLKQRTLQPAHNQVLNLLGLALIITSMLMFDEQHTVFPGFSALLPCLGAWLCLYTARSGHSSLILNNPVMVFLGKISYSLYLLHWPLIVYWLYVFGENSMNLNAALLLVGLSVLLAWLFYRFIEQPLRYPKPSTDRLFIRNTLIASVAVALLCGSMFTSAGWSWRFNDDMNQVIKQHDQKADIRQQAIRAPLCHHNDEAQPWASFIVNFERCNRISPDSVLVIGDSHAADLWVGLTSNLDDTNIIQLTAAACRLPNPLQRCQQLYAHVIQLLRQHPGQIKQVIYTQRGKNLDPDSIKQVTRYLNTLQQTGTQVLWFGPQMEYQPNIQTLLSRSQNLVEFAELGQQQQKNELFVLDEQLREAAAQSGIPYVSKLSGMCEQRVCDIISRNGDIYPLQRHHITVEGATHLVRRLLQNRAFTTVE